MIGVIPSLVGSLTCHVDTFNVCPALAFLSPVQNIIFLSVHFFTLLVQQPGQAGVLGRLSLYSGYLNKEIHYQRLTQTFTR
jgi:hypothetical protein